MATRLHAPWIREVETSTGSSAIETWHGELRACGTFASSLTRICRTRSAPDPRIPHRVGRLHGSTSVHQRFGREDCAHLRRAKGLPHELEDAVRDRRLGRRGQFAACSSCQTVPDAFLQESRPIAANVPPLGLSNRAIASEPLLLFASCAATDDKSSHSASAEEDQLVPESNDSYAAVLPINFTVASHPPFEEQLLGSTLWPEVRNLSCPPSAAADARLGRSRSFTDTATRSSPSLRRIPSLSSPPLARLRPPSTPSFGCTTPRPGSRWDLSSKVTL